MFEHLLLGDNDVLVYTTHSTLSPPWNNLTYLNNFDGTPYNFTSKDKWEQKRFGNCPWSQPGIKIGK